MNGRLVGAGIVAAAVLAGAGMYYLQVFAFYETLPPEAAEIEVAGATLRLDGFEGIDAASSPLRYRACGRVAALPEGLRPYPDAEPLNAPFWFDCFDAGALGAALASGAATAYLAQENVAPGVDRVLAVSDDGRAWLWHQLNGTLGD